MTEPTRSESRVLPYVIPMFGFLALTSLEGYVPQPKSASAFSWYPLVYAIKVAVVAGLAWFCRSAWRDLTPRPAPRDLALAVGLGLAVTILWVGLDGHYPELSLLGKRTAFDPNAMRPAARWAFIVVRFLGLAALVPLIEELFWRSFLIRWLIDPDFQNVPIGRVTPMAGALTALFFGLEHPEWLPGLITGAAWAWLLWRTKSVATCVVSHVVANLALGIYVIVTGDWKFW